MDEVGIDGAISFPFSMYRYDASYAVEVQRAHTIRIPLYLSFIAAPGKVGAAVADGSPPLPRVYEPVPEHGAPSAASLSPNSRRAARRARMRKDGTWSILLGSMWRRIGSTCICDRARRPSPSRATVRNGTLRLSAAEGAALRRLAVPACRLMSRNARSMVAALITSSLVRTSCASRRWPNRFIASTKTGTGGRNRLPQIRSDASQTTINASRTASS
jgi:hypothetical protein